MAEIGVMKKLTIGGSTYTIPEYSLPIASASTLGGVKIGTGLTINSTTGVLSATGLDFDEADPVFTASAAYGITSTDITNWNSKTSNTGTITKVQTSAGEHTIVNVSSGNVSFNVPTKTSHLTNDSGFITTDSDEKLKTEALASGVTYYPILANGANAAATRQVDSTLAGLKYVSSAGSTSTVGTATLYLGNTIASGSTSNEQGVLRQYGTTKYYHDIKAYTNYPTTNRTIYLPRYAGTMYLTCTSTTSAVGGSATAPVYVDSTGRIQAVTSIPYTLLSDTPTITEIEIVRW